MAKQRIQTQYNKSQARLNPQARPVDTYVQPSRNDQLSNAIDSVTGNMQRVQAKEERKLDLIQSGKSQAAQAGFQAAYKNLLENETFARMTYEQIQQTPEFQQIFGSAMGQVNDPLHQEMLSNNMQQTALNLNTISSQNWAQQDTRNAGAEFAQGTVDILIDELDSNFNVVDGQIVQDEFLTDDLRNQERTTQVASRIREIEQVLKEKYGYSNTDLQMFWLEQQERRGEKFKDTHIGDYLLAAGHGSPKFKNKVSALNAVAKANALEDEEKATALDFQTWRSEADAGRHTPEADIQAYNAYKAEKITKSEYLSLQVRHDAAVVAQTNAAYKQQAMAQAVGQLLKGADITDAVFYSQVDGSAKSISVKEVQAAARVVIDQEADGLVASGKYANKIDAQIDLYAQANVPNPQWETQIAKGFVHLGSGIDDPASPQGKYTLASFGLMKQLWNRNPEVFRTTVKSEKHRAMFQDWRYLTEAYNDEGTALSMLGKNDALGGAMSPEMAATFAKDIQDNLDGWFSNDSVEGSEAEEALFIGKMVEVAKRIAKYTQLDPSEIVDSFKQEVKNDYVSINGRLVYMGNTALSYEHFKSNAVAYLESIAGAAGMGALEAEQMTLKHTGRGDSFWVIDKVGRPVYGLPAISIDDIRGSAAEQKAAEINAEREAKANGTWKDPVTRPTYFR